MVLSRVGENSFVEVCSFFFLCARQRRGVGGVGALVGLDHGDVMLMCDARVLGVLLAAAG